MVGLLTPLKPPPPDIDPEMKRLMAVDLHEDSSDEEYNPDNEVVEQVIQALIPYSFSFSNPRTSTVSLMSTLF